tara:strand:+ start:160 stop:1113 length:954 start_codon:yes stop_codon:yes gene_type:complete
MNIIDPKAQLNLYGYENYFASFAKLHKKNKLPNVILLSGLKGAGKSTFVYHFVNYLLSQDEVNKYMLSNFKINEDNTSFKLIQNNMHPNFFLLENNLNDENIKIDQVRKLLKFLSKTTYSKNIKIVFIDNAEFLNNNSSNALLKCLEESSNNTFFFIVQNSSSKLLDTIKSRCITFKIYFNESEKEKIFNKIITNYELKYNENDIKIFYSFDSPGNILRNLSILEGFENDIFKDLLSSIFYLLEKYKNSKNPDLLNFISLVIQYFYNEQSIKNTKNLNNYFVSNYEILHQISNMKKFNLDKNNLLISISKILENEKK